MNVPNEIKISREHLHNMKMVCLKVSQTGSAFPEEYKRKLNLSVTIRVVPDIQSYPGSRKYPSGYPAEFA